MTSSPSSRRVVIAGLLRFGLVVLTLALVGGYVMRHIPGRGHVSLESDVPTLADSLQAGDLRIFSSDGAVELILRGERILAGLSPRTVAKVRSELDASMSRDSSGFAASIGRMVKESVAGAIDTHGSFPIADIEDIRYERERIVVDWKKGGSHEPFFDMQVDGSKGSQTFRREDAERFIAAVRERMEMPREPRT